MKYLMVCHGNICRSPMAMGVLKHKLSKINSKSEVDSCGFEPYHIGDAPDVRALKIMNEKGIDISAYRAKLFAKEDFDKFDKIFVMDKNNYDHVKYMARNDDDMLKVDYLMNVVYPGENNSVPDPYYGMEQGFRTTYANISTAAEAIVELFEK